MNNDSAKDILSAYRSDGSDAQDDFFKQALKQCQRDPELRAWLNEQTQFDSSIVRGLRDVHGPENGKKAVFEFAILEPKYTSKPARYKVISFISIGIAALLLLMIGLFNDFSFSPNRSSPDFDVAAFSVSQLVNHAMPLDYLSSDRTDIKNWLIERNAPLPPKFPGFFQEATAKGCRIFENGQGGQVSLFCFQKDGEFVHVLTFDEQTRPYLKKPNGEWWSEGDWNIVVFEEEQNLFAIATQLPPERFSKFM